MKKLLVIAATWISLAGCTKEFSSPAKDDKKDESTIIKEGQSASDVRATVKWTADPAVDGFGWVLQISPNHLEIPKNLPEAFKKDGIEVLVSYKQTSERFICRCSEPRYYVDITSIALSNP